MLVIMRRSSDLCRLMYRASRINESADAAFGSAVNWVGELDSIRINSQGSAQFRISTSQGLILRSGLEHERNLVQTNISHGDPIFREISQIRIGQRIIFSGFFVQTNNGNCFLDGSETISGSIEFIFMLFEVRILTESDSGRRPPTFTPGVIRSNGSIDCTFAGEQYEESDRIIVNSIESNFD